ncbi:MAG: endonuclease/exonuclease/phosphatase family protein [Phycisphaerales bacterium]|nr:endonuclease/exonuclease/phosphatase family protein [Phycisphaerales bacterium]
MLALLAAGAVWVAGRFAKGLIEALCSPWAFQCWLAFLVSAPLLLLARRWWFATLALALLAWSTPMALVGDLSLGPVGTGSTVGNGALLKVLHVNLDGTSPPTAGGVEWISRTEADLVVLEELSPAWWTALAGWSEQFPYQLVDPAPGVTGIGVLSRWPITAEFRQPAAGGFPFIDATVDLSGAPLRVLAVHPVPPVRADAVARRNAHLEEIAEQAVRAQGPCVVIGDLNETPYGAPMRVLLEHSGLRSAREGRGRLPTWPVHLPAIERRTPTWLMIPIDHVLVSPEVGVESFETGPAIGSDHLPVMATLRVGAVAVGCHGLGCHGLSGRDERVMYIRTA